MRAEVAEDVFRSPLLSSPLHSSYREFGGTAWCRSFFSFRLSSTRLPAFPSPLLLEKFASTCDGSSVSRRLRSYCGLGEQNLYSYSPAETL